jgi:peptidoglycan/LPS O-acetylase OafA/YrhL
MKGKSTTHLPFLNGIRGLAAVYVVAYHAFHTADSMLSGRKHTLPAAWETFLPWLDQGHTVVNIFIVLSGFCLMLPVVTNAERRLSGGCKGYLKRRARRILPPYFAALAISLVCIAMIPGLGTPADTYWDIALPAFDFNALLPHLFLFHNFVPNAFSKIDYPLWSVATECQIYLVFPILLLPIWRKFGVIAMLATALVVGLSPHYLFKQRFDAGCPHYLVLFVMGTLGSLICFDKRVNELPIVKRTPWGILAAVVSLPLLVLIQFKPDIFLWRRLGMDLLVGAGSMLLLVYCFLQKHNATAIGRGWLFVLESPVALWLGSISYSLYLIHAPALATLHILLRQFSLGPIATFSLLLIIGIPLSLLVAWGFYCVFEIPVCRSRDPKVSLSVAVAVK